MSNPAPTPVCTTIRLPVSLHAELTKLAAAEGVSLNMLMVVALGQYPFTREAHANEQTSTKPRDRGTASPSDATPATATPRG